MILPPRILNQPSPEQPPAAIDDGSTPERSMFSQNGKRGRGDARRYRREIFWKAE